jgi:HemK-like putative methylase
VGPDGIHRSLLGHPRRSTPSRAFAALERTLWEGASAGPLGYAEPDPESLALFLALQASRDGYRREERLRHLSDCLSLASLERTERLADRCGIRATLRWAVGEANRGAAGEGWGDGAPVPPPDGATLRAVWRVGRYLTRHAYPRRLRPLISGIPRLGGAVVRCRFSGVEVLAGPGIFVPEMTSERLVAASLDCLAAQENPIVVEAGTGCGAIALAVAAGHPGARVHAVEKFGPALGWARRNRRRLGQARVRLYRGSLLDPLPGDLAGRVGVVVANLPYVPATVWPDQGRLAKHAVRGQDEDGLGLYRRLLDQARTFLKPEGRIILEMGPYQVDAFRADARARGYAIERVEPPVAGAVVVTAGMSAHG